MPILVRQIAPPRTVWDERPAPAFFEDLDRSADYISELVICIPAKLCLHAYWSDTEQTVSVYHVRRSEQGRWSWRETEESYIYQGTAFLESATPAATAAALEELRQSYASGYDLEDESPSAPWPSLAGDGTLHPGVQDRLEAAYCQFAASVMCSASWPADELIFAALAKNPHARPCPRCSRPSPSQFPKCFWCGASAGERPQSGLDVSAFR